jgi:hypothetical protein
VLFIDKDGESFHLAEMAHIVAAANRGPRANVSLSPAERSKYENLLLLCPSCHTSVDKAPASYPETLVLDWKSSHRAKIAQTFSAVEYADRASARAAVEQLLQRNRVIHEQYGPCNDYRFDPESEIANIWKRKVLAQILPNNSKILAILDANFRHLNAGEFDALERFRQHTDDLSARHVGGPMERVGEQFPYQISSILREHTE